MSSLLNLENISLTFESGEKQVKVLRDIHFTAEHGQTISIVGPSGAGKTSLLMVAGGLEKPTAGTISFEGRDITGLDEDALSRFRRENISIVFQSFRLIPTMTALENVCLPLELSGETNIQERAKQALESVQLGARLDHYPAQLSGGEQQRVALARAFVTEPKILLADEPTGNLDKKTGEAVISHLFDLTAKLGTTLILVTHDPALATQCQRQITIEDGQLSEASTSKRKKRA